MTKWGAAGFAVVAMLGASGCSATVALYSDSIFADIYSGDVLRTNIAENTPDWQISLSNWVAAPGTQMAEYNANPRWDAGLLSPGATVTAYSFGTNDANYYAWGLPADKSHTAEEARFYALSWMERAFASGSRCVVWVLGNPTRYDGASYAAPGNVVGATRSGIASSQIYTDYMTNFNGWLTSLGTNVIAGGRSGKLLLVDWGAIARAGTQFTTADRVHPSATGAAYLGQLIKQRVKEC